MLVGLFNKQLLALIQAKMDAMVAGLMMLIKKQSLLEVVKIVLLTILTTLIKQLPANSELVQLTNLLLTSKVTPMLQEVNGQLL